MNPIWRLQHDIRRTRTDNEKRARQQREFQRHREEKEQRREDAIDRERQRNVAGQDAANDIINDELDKESPAEQFQRELCWCIQQLEQGLTSVKPTSKQAKDAEKLLRTLKSHKAPMVKKRQVMRMTFGDYRKKMMAEKQKHEKKKMQPTLTPVASDQQSLSTFYRHAYRCPVEDTDIDQKVDKQQEVNEKKDGEKIVTPQRTEDIGSTCISNEQEQSTFMFNFEIDKNLLDSFHNENQSCSEVIKLEDNDEQPNSGKRKNKGKKKRRIKDKNDEKGENKVEEKEADQSSLNDGCGDVQIGIVNLQMTGDAKPFKFNFDVVKTEEAEI